MSNNENQRRPAHRTMTGSGARRPAQRRPGFPKKTERNSPYAAPGAARGMRAFRPAYTHPTPRPIGPDARSMALAEQAIRRAQKGEPADAVLRKLFLEQKKLSSRLPRPGFDPLSRVHAPAEMPSADATHLVFSYYRWKGWLNSSAALNAQIAEADGLARKFRKSPEEFSDKELLERSFPSWVPGEAPVTPELVRALQGEPRLWLRARRGLGLAITKKLGSCVAFGSGRLADVLRYFGREDIFRTAAYQAGDLQIQDLSSQAVGFMCDPQPGETWWDACAGEGGKTLHLSELMENKGLIWASDKSEWRLRRLRMRAGKGRMFNYRVAEWDGGEKLPTKTLFHGVLVDAPCSGLGTWHRNPHARWTTQPQDVRELAAVQLDLLARVARSLKPGGKLVYSVCTITTAETHGVADAFEKRFPQFQPMSLKDPLGGGESTRRLYLPQEHGGNGMFVAAWRAP